MFSKEIINLRLEMGLFIIPLEMWLGFYFHMHWSIYKHACSICISFESYISIYIYIYGYMNMYCLRYICIYHNQIEVAMESWQNGTTVDHQLIQWWSCISLNSGRKIIYIYIYIICICLLFIFSFLNYGNRY